MLNNWLLFDWRAKLAQMLGILKIEHHIYQNLMIKKNANSIKQTIFKRLICKIDLKCDFETWQKSYLVKGFSLNVLL
jgi:hypothetical protein